jgi:hypothetical protein
VDGFIAGELEAKITLREAVGVALAHRKQIQTYLRLADHKLG